MKPFVLLISFLFSGSARGQSAADKIMDKATCDCFIHLFSTQNANNISFNQCFLHSVGKDTVLLKNEYLKVYGDSTAKSASKLGGQVIAGMKM